MNPFARAASTLAVAASLLVAGCVPGGGTIEGARAAMAEGDLAAAQIQLKNVLQDQPDSPEARHLLGVVLLRQGEPARAKEEFDKALALKYDRNRVLPMMAQSLMASGEARKLVEEYAAIELDDPRASSELKSRVAAAHVALGQLPAASRLVTRALELNPDNVEAGIIQARLLTGQGAGTEALSKVADLLGRHPKRQDLMVLQGELLWMVKGDAAAAAKAFQAAIAVDGKFAPAYTALANMHLANKDVEAFRTQVAAFQAVFPDLPEARYYSAQLAFIDNDLRKALDGARHLQRQAPENPYVNQLLGAIELRSGALYDAENHLSRAVAALPKSEASRLLMAEAQLRSGQPAKALVTLQPLLEGPTPSADVLSAAAESHLHAGDAARAQRLYEQAARQDPTHAKSQSVLALSQIDKGNLAAGFGQLQRVAASDKGTFADMALVSAHLRRGEFDAAMKAIDTLETKMPGKALPQHLRGQIHERRSNVGEARKAYERAMAADASYSPSLMALVRLDISERNVAVAQQRLEAALLRDPGSLRALMALADLKARRQGSPEEAIKYLEDAIRLNPGDPEPRMALVEYLLSQRKPEAALTVIQDASTAFPNHAPVTDLLGRTLLATGDTGQAAVVFRKYNTLAPNSPNMHLRQAEALLNRKDYRGAEKSLRLALQTSPKLLVAQRQLIQVALADNRAADALKVADSVKTERPSEAIGHVLEGEIHIERKDWPAARAAYAKALRVEPSSEAALRLYRLHGAAGQQADAERFATEWLGAHPRDTTFLFDLALLALDRRDLAGAEDRFRQLLTLAPNNASAANNIAWLLVKQGKPGALAFAEQANKLLPDNAAMLDTLALVHAADKNWPKAVAAQQQAVKLAPAVSGYRLNLVRHLQASGDRDAARRELQPLLDPGVKLSDPAAVKQLAQALR